MQYQSLSLRKLFLLIATLYKLVTTLRNTLYDRAYFRIYKSTLPVICIGNLSAGGNGKTPLVLKIATNLKQSGYKPVILSRGHGGSEKGPVLIQSSHSSAQIGDEPLMLFKQNVCPVIISKDRVFGAKFIENNGIADVILLDDAYQHRALGRDLNIICAYVGTSSAIDHFKKGKLLPWGRFRESKHQGLARADAIVFNSRNLEPVNEAALNELTLDLPESLAVFSTHLIFKGLYSESSQRYVEIEDHQQYLAFCGLGNPQGFIDSLNFSGLKIADVALFADHYQFSDADIDGLLQRAAGKPLICSEKDAIRFPIKNYPDIYVFKTEISIKNETELMTMILDSIKNRAVNKSVCPECHKDKEKDLVQVQVQD